MDIGSSKPQAPPPLRLFALAFALGHGSEMSWTGQDGSGIMEPFGIRPAGSANRFKEFASACSSKRNRRFISVLLALLDHKSGEHGVLTLS